MVVIGLTAYFLNYPTKLIAFLIFVFLNMSEIAVLILESPWEYPQGGTRRLTVQPFFEGLEKIHPNMSMYYSTFHDLHGVRTALDYDLLHAKEPRQVLYIGSHGQGRQLSNIRLSDLKRAIRERSGKLEGIIISACEVCNDVDDLITLVQGTGVKWAIGYKCAVGWFDSMMLELALLNQLAIEPVAYRTSRAGLTGFFQRALALVNPCHILDEEGKGVVADNVTIVMNSRRGSRPVGLRVGEGV